jgi:hypothetical protein
VLGLIHALSYQHSKRESEGANEMKNWEADAEAATTPEARKAHAEKCPALIKCRHNTTKVNEYGDCFNCDGEGRRMCPCQDWKEE